MCTQVLREDRAVWEPGERLAPTRGTGRISALGRNSHVFEPSGHYKVMSAEGREEVIGNHKLPLPGSAPACFVTACGKGWGI